MLIHLPRKNQTNQQNQLAFDVHLGLSLHRACFSDGVLRHLSTHFNNASKIGYECNAFTIMPTMFIYY